MTHVRLSTASHHLASVVLAVLALALTAPVARAQTIAFTPAPGSPAGAGGSPFSVAVGDFNNDGLPDYAVANAGDNTVSVFLGNGDGTFSPAPRSPLIVNRNPFPTPCLFTKCSSVPLAVAVGDFNGDGKSDLAVTNIPINDLCSVASVFGQLCSSVAILLGTGDGSFQDSNQFDPGGQLSTSIAIGDFNDDGRQDLAISNLNSSTVSILLGDGTGRGFRQAPGSPMAVGKRPTWVSVGDFDQDGLPDLAVANAEDGTVSILLARGDGTFGHAFGSPHAVSTRPISIAVGDVDGDGQPDLAVANFAENTISILLGGGEGTFGTPGRRGVGGHPASMAFGDFNGDGKLDLVVANRLSNSVSVLRGSGDGTFTVTRNLPTAVDPQSVVAVDVNGDGALDLVVASPTIATASVFLNTTDVVPPTTSVALSPVPNSNGWHKTSVRLSLVATDNPGGSGVKQIHYAIGSSQEVVAPGSSTVINFTSQGIVPVRYHAMDIAGNVETARSLTVRVDLASPTISPSQAPPPNTGGWNTSNVTVSFSCADALSGVAACTSPVTVSAEGANQTVLGTVSDLAGNSATTTRVINLDKTPPALTMPALLPSYALNTSMPLTFAASDSLSGLASMQATLNGSPVTSDSTVTLTRPGTNTFTLTATDVAGNTATQTATFTVLYTFSGFLPPISNDGSTVFRLGRTVPVKFQLTGAGGAPVSTAVAYLRLQMLSNGTPVGDPIEGTPGGSADTGNVFRYAEDQYVYNLSTASLTVGMWQIQVLLDDGTDYRVAIGTR